MVVRVAVAQGVGSEHPDEVTVAANVEVICRLMGEAAAAGARVAVFTEGALSSYPGKRIVSSDPDRVAEADWSRVAWATVDAGLVRVRQLAAELGIWVVVGCIWRTGAPRPYNSLMVINDQGSVAARYDKRTLSNTEAGFMYQAGDRPVVVTIDGLKFGFLLCIEAMLPDLMIDYDRRGVDAVVIASYTDQTPAESQDDQRALAYAHLINAWVLFAVPGVNPDCMISGIAAPGFVWLDRGAPDGRPLLAIADLDRDDPMIKLGREAARPWRAMQRQELDNR